MRNTLVFGASPNPARYSYIAIERLVEQGLPTLAFGLREGRVKGVQIQTTLDGIRDVHTLTLYMRPSRQPRFYDVILKIRPKRVIFNPGAENPDFYGLLEAEGIEVLEACTLVMLSMRTYFADFP
jgi:predicted CoA-binding protein